MLHLNDLPKIALDLWASFRRIFPVPYQLLIGAKTREHLVLRVLLLTLYGLLLGILFHQLVLVNLDLPATVKFYIGLAVALALGLGCALSLQVRCIGTLCLTGFLGRAGRNVLKTLTITLVLAGPIGNMVLNGKEVARVLVCSSELAFNLTLTRVDLMSKPFQNALLGSRTRLPELKREFSEIVSIVEPLVREVEGSMEANHSAEQPGDGSILSAADYQDMYAAKLNERCLAQLETGVERCQRAFEKSYDECSESLPPVVNALLCWPMKIDLACSSAELFGVGTVCKMEDVLDDDFGENYRLLKVAERQLTGGVSNVEMDFELPDLRNHPGFQTIKNASKQMGHELGERMEALGMLMYLVRKVFAFIFLRVIYYSVRYHNEYLWKIDFSNFYLTEEFRIIDARRASEGHSRLLPFRAVQRTDLVDTRTGIWNRRELSHVVGALATLTFHGLSTTVLILMDALLSETLEIVARHSAIEYQQQGYHSVNVTVRYAGRYNCIAVGHAPSSTYHAVLP
ncbi:protein sneaky-like isoform X2 [Anopheles albimanus]|uniref:protein sneaky-like isoform X2 n=1 Tax=Anopheles albimanus TaxID=7167 RepID=UPI0016412699|nr:protein sneaky-like isoform X2 [Anopheles albimanus]